MVQLFTILKMLPHWWWCEPLGYRSRRDRDTAEAVPHHGGGRTGRRRVKHCVHPLCNTVCCDVFCNISPHFICFSPIPHVSPHLSFTCASTSTYDILCELTNGQNWPKLYAKLLFEIVVWNCCLKLLLKLLFEIVVWRPPLFATVLDMLRRIDEAGTWPTTGEQRQRRIKGRVLPQWYSAGGSLTCREKPAP